jgi:predicted nucleotidyltransferase component of viral defense system
MDIYSPLQVREIFHMEFLRWLGRAVKPENYAVKGGVNLRFFFKSFRYSEDMDIDARNMKVFELQEAVMKILNNRAFRDNLKPFGITRVTAPDIAKAKQTLTTQRFKIHLLSLSGEDLFTKIEFSRRGFAGSVITGPVDDSILRAYKLAPIMAAHYDCYSAAAQKLGALASRASVQARDIFDIFILSPQCADWRERAVIDEGTLMKALERVSQVSFGQFRDTVVSYLSAEDQGAYDNPSSWEGIQKSCVSFIREAMKGHE